MAWSGRWKTPPICSSRRPFARRDSIGTLASGGACVAADPQRDQAEQHATDQLGLMLERARQGDETVLPQLREFLDTKPELWRRYGDLALHARQAWIGLIAGTDLALRESIARRVDE